METLFTKDYVISLRMITAMHIYLLTDQQFPDLKYLTA